MKTFDYDIIENENFQLLNTGKKRFYNLDGNISLSEWMESDIPKNDIDFPVFESALGVTDKYKKGCSTAIAYINNDSNNVQQQNVVHIMNGVCKANGNKPITIENFYKMVVGFTARKIIKRSWIVDKDEFLKPNLNHSEYDKFKADSLVYSLFHIHSFQTSLREIEYKEQNWNVKNEFFWMSVNRIKELADEKGYDILYNDARVSSERHVYKLLHGPENIYEKLSPDAKLVINTATELVERSIEQRQVMATDENHLDSWDAGYAQLKLVWKEYFPEEFKQFRQLYKNLEDRMRPLVYELGFLMK